MEKDAMLVFSFTLEEIRQKAKLFDLSKFGVICKDRAFILGEPVMDALHFIPLSQIEERVARSGFSAHLPSDIHFVAFMIGDFAGEWIILEQERFNKIVLGTMVGPSTISH